MNLVILAAFLAVCSAAKLDRSYLPPPSAATAGGSSASLQTPLTRTTDQGFVDLPTGSFTNNFQGVVVEAAGPGTRASLDSNQSGLGAPRESYGSIHSKVGEAAFRESLAGFRAPVNSGGFERPKAAKDRNSNVISYSNDVSVDNYSYGFETDNGIAVGENGIANNGIQAQGGYSFEADDGQVYKVTYTADEGGYRPQGSHLPTPPPIPKEILESLEQNAKDEAAGLVDDGSYDAQKYNAEGDYTHHNGGNRYNGAQSHNAKRPESDVTASGTFINQNSQAFEKPSGQFGNIGQSNANFNGLSTQLSGQSGSAFASGNNYNNRDKESSQTSSGSQGSLPTSFPSTGQASGSLTGQFGQTQGSFGLNSQFGSHNSQHGITGNIEGQSSFGHHSSSPQLGIQSSFQLGAQSSQTGSQFGTQSTKPSGQNSPNQASNNKGDTSAQFGAQSSFQLGSLSSQAGLQFGTQPTKPLGQSSPNQASTNQASTNPGHSSTQFGAQSSFALGSQSNQAGSQFVSQPIKPSGQSSANQASTNQGHSSGQFGAQSSFQLGSLSSQAGLQFGTQSTRPPGQSSNNQISNNQGQFGAQSAFQLGSLSSQAGLQFGTQPVKPSGQTSPNEASTNQGHSSAPFGTQTSFPLGSQSGQAISQIGTQSSRPLGQSSTNQASNNQASQFGIHSQKPQGSFGQVQNSQSSGQGLPELNQNHNSNLPSTSSIDSNKPINGQFTNNIGSSTDSNSDRFPNAQNQFVTGYLPPFTTNNKPSYSNTQAAVSTQQEQNKDQSTLNLIPAAQIQGLSSASAFASTGQPGFESQPAIFNNFQSQILSKPNQFNYNSPTNQGTFNNLPISSETNAPNLLGLNPTKFSQSKPTAIPNIELTTPLEPNEKPAFEQGSFFNSQSTSGVSGFGSKPQNNQAGSQLSAQGNFATSQQSSQNLTPSIPTSIPQRVPQISVTPTLPSSTPATFTTAQQGTFSQTIFAQNQQQNSYYSTPKPSFSQGPDDSYYYNQPSKPFNTPGRPQGSRFPSTPSYQFNNGVSQNNQFTNQQIQGISSNNYNSGITQAAASPFPSVSPTTSTQFGAASTGQFGSKPSFSQTSLPPFPQSNKPNFSQQQTQNFPLKPTTSFGQQNSYTQSQFGQSSTNRPFTSENVDTQTASTLSQQYQGTIYQYNKPAVTLPPPEHSGSSSNQNVPTDSSSKPQGQQSSTTVAKPQFGSQQTQFTQNAFAPQKLQTSLNLGSRPQITKPFGNLPPLDPNFGNTQASFTQTSTQNGYQNNVQPSKPNSGGVTTSQFGQGSFQTYKPFGSQFSQNTQSSFGSQITKQPSKPFGSSNTQFGQTVQSQGSYSAGVSNQQNSQQPQGNAQPPKPFGTGSVQFGTSSNQGVTTKPQYTTQTQFTQQQSFESTQFGSQPSQGHGSTLTTQTSSSTHGSPETLKPHYGQNNGGQGNTQVFQDTFTFNKPQIGSQFGQNINASPNQASSSKGQDSSSVGTTQAPEYKPFSSSFKPQTGAISGSVTGSQTSSQENQSSEQSPCCQGSSGSTITAVNLSKPSQAFAQTQSQFSGAPSGQFSASSVAGKGEEFGGPREPPKFDATGYHY